jgi:two-component system, cell cycle sensor histidine kinase and response regulator CckA
MMMAGTPQAERRTILLVDDEEAVRSIVLKILRRANYDVIEARDGTEALAIAGAHKGKIDLVLSDMYMPGMRGPELVSKLLPTLPGIRALFMSGYADPTSRSALPEGANFLHKPFSGQELGAAVEAALAGPPLR